MSTDYKSTIFLPKTSFSMRASLPQKEPMILKKWKDMNLDTKIQALNKDKEPFVLHDGPPYANGHIHVGHAFNKILKDVVNRYHHLDGKHVNFVIGWDCHGLPIEWKIEEGYRKKGKEKDDIPFLDFRKECREYADTWIKVQREGFQRLGLLANWETPYITMSFEAEAKVVEELGKFFLNGSLYKGVRPVQWSVVEKTALAEAEVEYKDKTSSAIDVAFPVAETKIQELKDAAVVIWTTTPWTLPGNRAIAYGDDILYSLVEITDKTNVDLNISWEKVLIAEDLIDAFCQRTGISQYEIQKTYKGRDLEGMTCHHPFVGQGYDFSVPLIPGDHVTTEAGTGLVHTAPGHGQEDFVVGNAFGLEVPQTVGPDGVFYKHVPLFGGQHVYKVNPVVLDKLAKAKCLLSAHDMVHSYPHSWRSKAPLIFRTTPQWFISMEKNHLRDKALQGIEDTQWYPQQARQRITSMVRDRPDWCVSRQRAWGTPIPIFIHKETGTPLRDGKVWGRVVEKIRKDGGDAWFQYDNATFLAPDYNPDDYEKVTDILDVWFDSGCTHAFVLEDRNDQTWPADLYLEGSDQHRGWFQSSLLEACGTRGSPPYKSVLTHGFVMGEDGRKMSKSAGDALAPHVISEQMGIEILRLWVVGSDYTEDVNLSPGILKYYQDIYRRYRNTLRYLLGGLRQYSVDERVDYDQLPELEKWVLHRLQDLDRQRKEAFKNYRFQSFFHELHTFCSTDLSAFYFDIRKDSLYCDAPEDLKRRSLRTVFSHVFDCLTTWLAPVLCFTTEEAFWAHKGEDDSIHLQIFPELPKMWYQEGLAEKYQKIRKLRGGLTYILERMREKAIIGSSLQAKLNIYDPENRFDRQINWAELSIASEVVFINHAPTEDVYPHGIVDMPNIVIQGQIAQGEKCGRCWRVLPEVGQLESPDLCQRCDFVVKTLQMEKVVW